MLTCKGLALFSELCSWFFLKKISNSPLNQRLLKSLFILSLLLSSCGYRTLSHLSRIDVAPIEGDHAGNLRSHLIESLSSSSYIYDPASPDYELHVEVLEDASNREDGDIGVRYARSSDGDKSDLLVSTERRAVLVARLSLTDLSTNKPLSDPVVLRASYDYEFDSDLLDDKAVSTASGTQPLIRYSYGQMENAPAARETAYSLLEKKLAHRIALYLQLAR